MTIEHKASSQSLLDNLARPLALCEWSWDLPGAYREADGKFSRDARAIQRTRVIVPNIEYRDRMTLHRERAFELYYVKNIHSEADSAIGLPNERVLITAAW